MCGLKISTVFALLTIGISCLAQRQEYQAQAFGEGTQAGHTFNVTVIINEYSTEEDQQILLQSLNKAGMNGVTNALNKMKTKGRISMTGTLGYEVSYIRLIPTPTGSKIRLVTNRPITVGEAWTDSQSQDFSLSALELDVDNNDKKKSTGTLLPLCQFKITKDHKLEIEANQNPWRLTDVIDRTK
jgi:hypothetical protein